MKKTERERLQLWLEVDVFGLHEEGLVAVSDRCRPMNTEVPLKIDQRFIAEPGMPLWKPLREALKTAEEQDSDVYFVLRGSGEEGGAAAGGGVELGTAHVNLEQLQKRGRDVVRERLSVIDTQERKVASLVVSVRALDALRWVARGADEGCRLGVGVGLLELSAGGRERLGTASKQSVLVRVELPQGLPSLRTREVRLSEKRVDFGFYGDVEVAPGSAQQGALAAALASAAEEESSVDFVLLAAGVAGGERERELGSGSVALHTLLRDGADEEEEEEEARLVLPLTAGAKQAPLGTLEVALKALTALKALLASSVASVAALPPPTATQLVHRAKGKALTEPLLQDYSMEDSDDEGASSGVPWALLDGLEVPAGAADLLASPRGATRTKGAARRAAKEQPAATPGHGAAELAAMLQAARQLSRARPAEKDWQPERWSRDRVIKLWRLLGIVTQHGLVERELAQLAQQGTQLQLLQARASRAAAAQRQQQRLAQAATRAPGGGKAADGGRLLDELLRREALGLYERLLHSLHATAHAVLDQLAVLARQCERSQLLLEGWQPGHEARLRRVLEGYSHVLARCALVDAAPNGEGRTAGLSVESLEELKAVAAGVLGPQPPLQLDGMRRGGAAAAPHHGLGHGDGARAAWGVEGGGPGAAAELVDADDDADLGAVRVDLRAGRLRLSGDALGELRGQAVQVAIALLPASLHLPAVRSPSAVMHGAELDLGYTGSLTLGQGGGAFRRMLALLHDAPRSSRHGPAPLQLQLQLLASRAAGAPRVFAAGSVPLWPLLGGEELAAAAAQVTLLRHGSTSARCAEVEVEVRAPELVAALHAQMRAAAAASVTVRELCLEPAVLREAGGLGGSVWVEVDAMGLAGSRLRTAGIRVGPEARARFEHEFRVPVARGSEAEARLVEQLRRGAPEVRLSVCCASAAGPVRVAHGVVAVEAEGHAQAEGGQRWHHTVELRRAPPPGEPPSAAAARPGGGAPVGTLTLTLLCREVLRAALARMQEQPVVQVALLGLRLAAHLQRDVGLRSVWVEVSPPACLQQAALVSTRVPATHGALAPALDATLEISAAQIEALSALLHETRPDAPRPTGSGDAAKPAKPTKRSERAKSAEAEAAPTKVRSRLLPTSLKRGSTKPRPTKAAAGKRQSASSDESEAEAEAEAEVAAAAAGARRGSQGSAAATAHMDFVVRAEHWRGDLTLASARVELREMLTSGEDKLASSLSMRDANGQCAAQLDPACNPVHPACNPCTRPATPRTAGGSRSSTCGSSRSTRCAPRGGRRRGGSTWASACTA